MKTLLTALAMVALSSCAKHLDVIPPQKTLSVSEFSSMLTKDKTYMVANYYTLDSAMSVPFVNSEDTYTFDAPANDGWISSKFPCVEYHYNFRVFTSGDNILFNWLDFKIAPQTFTVADYKQDEWFILQNGNTYARYVLVRPTE